LCCFLSRHVCCIRMKFDFCGMRLIHVLVRNFFLVQVARELDLRFPSSTATATTIWSMHQAVEGGIKARRKLRVMVIAFVAALILRVASQYAIGILWVKHTQTSPDNELTRLGLAPVYLDGNQRYRS
jgi:hypothetical protein